jgi:hypothetical protein
MSSVKNIFGQMNGKLKLLSLFSIVLIIMIQTSCNWFGKSSFPDVESYKKEIDLIRFEKLLFELDTLNLVEDVEKLAAEHPALFNIYFNRLLGFNYGEDSSFFYQSLTGFLKDEKILELKKLVSDEYGDFSSVEDEFKEAFAYMSYYFPSFEQPEIITLFAEYTIQLFLFGDKNGKDGVGIGLDMFLGGDFPYGTYFPDNPSFSAYLTRSFNKDHIVKKTMEALIQDRMPDPEQERLLDIMIHHGKKLYALDQVLPTVNDSIIMEFSAEEINWCKQNELEMWAFFFKEELFYESDINKINKFIYPSPHSPGMPDAAPGRTGNYMGWKIVEAYMKKFPETTLDELFKIKDAQKLLELSKYKPKRM